MDEIRDFIHKYSFYDTGESENGTECVEMPVSELMRLIELVEEEQDELTRFYFDETENGNKNAKPKRVSQQLTEKQ